MANHFRQTAETLREIADRPAALLDADRAVIRHAADVLCRLEQLKRDLISSDHNDEAESDRLSNELLSLLGIHRGS